MQSILKIRMANRRDAKIVTQLVCSLLSELGGERVNDQSYREAAGSLLNGNSDYTVFLGSTESGENVGLISVSGSGAVYTKGNYGIIHELYVKPEYRSQNVGGKLLEKVVEYARQHKWTRLEVATPNPHLWERTVAFYRRNAFEQIGISMKKVLLD